MKQVRVDKIYTALDIGSSKVSAMIAGISESGELVVLGTGQRASAGVKRGYVTDMAKTEFAVRDAVEQAERLAGVNVDDVWVGCTGGGLTSRNQNAEIEIGGGRVEREDIEELLALACESIQPDGRMVLHATPALYLLDGVSGVDNPVGLHADRLGVDVHVVLADGAPVRNIDLCVRQAHLHVRDVVAAPIAAGAAVLTKEERELGVALIEIGAAVTNISLYAGGILVDFVTIAFGSADITDSIASSFGIQRHQAERLKCFYGSATSSKTDHRDMIPILGPQDAPLTEDDKTAQPEERDRISRADLISVISAQLNYLLGEVKTALKHLGFIGSSGRPIVLTGGGAELKGIADYAQIALGCPARIGRPLGLRGLPEAHSGPAFSTLAGLVLHAVAGPTDIRTVAAQYQHVHRYAGKSFLTRIVLQIWRAAKANF